MELTEEELRQLWSTWMTDRTLQTEFRFGQFVCNRKLQPGWVWAEVYYASTEVAWQRLYELASKQKPFTGRRV
jgi:hypothetical protein